MSEQGLYNSVRRRERCSANCTNSARAVLGVSGATISTYVVNCAHSFFPGRRSSILRSREHWGPTATVFCGLASKPCKAIAVVVNRVADGQGQLVIGGSPTDSLQGRQPNPGRNPRNREPRGRTRGACRVMWRCPLPYRRFHVVCDKVAPHLHEKLWETSQAFPRGLESRPSCCNAVHAGEEF